VIRCDTGFDVMILFESDVIECVYFCTCFGMLG
jgi:hypothetical protein